MHHFDQKPIILEVLQMEWCVPLIWFSNWNFRVFHVNDKHPWQIHFNDVMMNPKCDTLQECACSTFAVKILRSRMAHVMKHRKPKLTKRFKTDHFVNAGNISPKVIVIPADFPRTKVVVKKIFLKLSVIVYYYVLPNVIKRKVAGPAKTNDPLKLPHNCL